VLPPKSGVLVLDIVKKWKLRKMTTMDEGAIDLAPLSDC